MSVKLALKVGSAALFAALVAITDASAQTQVPPQVCMDEAAFRQFDFWVGEWDVYSNANGNLAGRNRIESQENGCVLVEHWTSSSGGTGISMNYYDSLTNIWRQVWVASNYSIDIEGGLNQEGSMALVGQLHNYRSGLSFDFRGTWTPNEDGSVRQFFEQKNPRSGEWQVWFDGKYVPRT